jgi:hypothetical protein
MPLIVKKGKHFNLKQMKEWGEKHFHINEEYQRSKMWSDEKKQLLLDSIINRYPIGTFILKKRPDGSFEVLDGQQRIDAICCFINGTPTNKPLRTSAKTKKFPEKTYQDLLADAELSANFDAFDIYYDEIEGDDDQEIATIFLRLQEGVPLNSAEKLNAMSGKMRKFVFTISQHPLFGSVRISKYRFAHRLIAAQITLLEHESDFNHTPYPEFPNLRFNDLKKMYEECETEFPRGLSRRTMGTLDTIFQALRDDVRVIRKKSDLPLVYLLTTYLRKKYVLDFRLLRDFIVKFFTQVALVRLEEGKMAENQYERYVELRKKGLTHETFSERFRIILGLFLKEAPSIQLKDAKRSFDVGQKLAIYYNKNNRECQHCHRGVDWGDASFHHFVFHNKGGPTTVENGQLMHVDCHREFHKKEGPDKE